MGRQYEGLWDEPASRYEIVTFYYSNYLGGQAWLGDRKGADAYLRVLIEAKNEYAALR